MSMAIGWGYLLSTPPLSTTFFSFLTIFLHAFFRLNARRKITSLVSTLCVDRFYRMFDDDSTIGNSRGSNTIASVADFVPTMSKLLFSSRIHNFKLTPSSLRRIVSTYRNSFALFVVFSLDSFFF